MIHIGDFDYNDYEERRNKWIDYDNGIRFCSCGRRMMQCEKETEIWGHTIVEHKWECPVCD